MTDKTRAEFEAWAAERAPFILDKLAQDDDGGRLAAATAWLAWQAALATKTAEPEVPALRVTVLSDDPLPPFKITVLTNEGEVPYEQWCATPPPAPLREPPEGWVLVPREPTPEMLAAMDGADDTDFEVGRGGDYEKMYAAAIEAAQPAQAEKKETP